ncbi:MAG TPA: CHASE domain-containing protein [Candidatus Binatia bacterium]|nr:CHASE domain-containing protein [Candidatus Binatia bacterium]
MPAPPEGVAPSRAHALIAFAAVVAGYYVSGRLGLLLAIPPGYATAIWPASGVALAAVLLGGSRMALAVALGSLLINLPATLHSGGHLVVTAVIACGAAAQAVIGARLIGRVFQYRNLLTQEHYVIPMLLLGGPLACLTNAVAGPLALWAGGSLPASGLAFNMWNWWVGDSIGVLVFAPLVLVWAVRPYSQWLFKQIFVTLPLMLLFGVVVASFVFIQRREQARVRLEFEGLGRDVAVSLQQNLDSTLGVLSSLEGLYASVDRVEGYQFEIFASRLVRHLDGIEALAWMPWVPESQRVAFERAQQKRVPGFQLRQFDPVRGLVPAARSESHAVIQYAVPAEMNRRMLGFDAASDPVRREALLLARDSGRAVVSGSVTLVQAPDAGPGVIVYMPVYRQGSQPHTLAARRKYLQGFAVASFAVADLMRGTTALATSHGVAVRLFDDGAGSAERLLLGDAPAAGPAGATMSVPLYFAGRPWRLEIVKPAVFGGGRDSWQVWVVLAGGLLLTSLVGMLLLTAQGRTARVEALVAERTAELQKLNSHLTGEVRVRARLENEAAQRANELAEKNLELQRRDDITRELLRNLRRSEGELRRTAARLSASNRELEQYAYVTSHDLKAPLRSISSFAQLLARRHGKTLEPEAREFLDFIADGIRHMQELIDDLLQLSRLDAGRLDLQTVPASRLVEQACKQLAADIRAANADVQSGTLPDVICDARLLTQLLQNLIGNALKFQTPGQRPQIRVEVLEEGDFWHFTVADNGIGIDPRYLDQIFLIFKRLHTQDQYPGNGIGLAVCRKVMQLHGGEIWAESALGEGTRFHFTLPRKAEITPEKVAA